MFSYQGHRCWPPLWTNNSGKRLTGEIGILDSIFGGHAGTHLFHIVIEHDQESYAGTLVFDSSEFCTAIAQLLRSNLRRSIQEIGAIEIS